MRKTKTPRYDVAEHLRTPKEMAAYLECVLRALAVPETSALAALAVPETSGTETSAQRAMLVAAIVSHSAPIIGQTGAKVGARKGWCQGVVPETSGMVGVIQPTLLLLDSVNQRLPSAPTAILV
jgi:hypothetical protein